MILIPLIDSTSDQLLGKQQIPVMMSSYHTEPVARFRQLKLEQSTAKIPSPLLPLICYSPYFFCLLPCLSGKKEWWQRVEIAGMPLHLCPDSFTRPVWGSLGGHLESNWADLPTHPAQPVSPVTLGHSRSLMGH